MYRTLALELCFYHLSVKENSTRSIIVLVGKVVKGIVYVRSATSCDQSICKFETFWKIYQLSHLFES